MDASSATANLPERGIPAETLLSRLASLKTGNADWHNGRTFSLVYHVSDTHHALLTDAYTTHFSENGLNPTAFPSLAQMERDIITISGSLFHAPPGFAGTLQSGGTESILCAMLAYRDRALARGIRSPELVLSSTAHVAFHKAAHYFGFALNVIPVRADHTVDPEAFRKAISPNTMAVVASAPAYPSGQLDPITEIAAICEEKNVPLHVDACVGGFFLPFLKDAPVWDFRLPGVTSISADLHKYGYAAKGASVLVWQSESFLEHQIYVLTDWSGGVYASTGLLGTRPGGAYAAAWTALQALGQSGYRTLNTTVMNTTQTLQEGIRGIAGLDLLGKPDMSVFAVVSTDPALSIYAVADVMEEKGWFIDRQQKPESIHVTITPAHSGKEPAILADLAESVETVRRHPERALSGKAAQYGMIARVPARGLIQKEVRNTMAGMVTGRNSGMPTETPWWQKALLKVLRK
jgi:glutamate/tyrosine decarboxylase-like PLP-dependent enzyme